MPEPETATDPDEVPVQRTGPIGRLVRLVMGLGLLFLISWPVSRVTSYHETAVLTQGTFWFLNVGALLLIPYVVEIGLSWANGRTVQLLVLGLAGPAAGLGLVLYGAIWSLPLALYVFLVQVWVFGALALGYLLAAVLGTPGCELRAFAHLAARIKGRDASVHFCPAGLDALDAWEARRGGS